jgi:prepilin peptidase CpaA
MLLTVLSLVFPVVMVLAMVADFRTFEIPNELSLVLALGYPLAALSAGFSWQQILWAIALGGLMLVIAVIMIALGILGGGDGKLLAAAVLWTGQERILEFLLVTALAGGALTMALMLYRRLPLADQFARIAALRKMHAEKRNVPYAVAIGGAGLIIYPHLPILNS